MLKKGGKGEKRPFLPQSTNYIEEEKMKKTDMLMAVGMLFVAWGLFGIIFAGINYFDEVGGFLLEAGAAGTVIEVCKASALDGAGKAAIGAVFILIDKLTQKKSAGEGNK